MRLKLLLLFVVLTMPFSMIAQDSVYWNASSTNGSWDWGSGCALSSTGNWSWNSFGTDNRSRPDCSTTYNKIYFDNSVNTTMNLNSSIDYTANQIQFLIGTTDRILNTDSFRSIYFQNNNGNCKIENNASGTTQTFNIPIFINSGNNTMEINPEYGFLIFNNTISNNSNNTLNVNGNQQVTFSGNITGTSGVTINSNANVVYSGASKTYSGTTTINTGSKLIISSNQTLGNITLNGGTLQINSGATLTITGSYTASGGIVNNNGTIKFAGGSVNFPDNASINNGATNTLSSVEIASSGTVTLNAIVNVSNTIIVSSGILKLGGYNLHLKNSTLNIAAAGTFDNGGENQIVNDGGGTIDISGMFITRDAQGFVGVNSAIPSITPILNSGSTVNYGLNGNQAVQGATAPVYSNITFSGSGTKTLVSGNAVSGTITVSGTAVFDSSNFTFGGVGTNITMTESSVYKLGGSGTKPTSTGTYSLGNSSTFEFTGSSATNIRLSAPTITYANIIVSGSNVSNTGTATGIKFQTGGNFTVKSGATFKINNASGFSGDTNTGINTILNGGPTITLETGSTIEYAGANQTITPISPSYSNLTISGTGLKSSIASTISIGNDLNINSSQLTISEDQTFIVNNKVNNSGGTFTIENNGSLVQINDTSINVGEINYERKSNSDRNTDYTYWSTPVTSSQTLSALFPKTLEDMYYSYQVTNTSEDWKQENSNTTMAIGKGYIIRGPEPNPPFPPSFPTAFFTGIPNNGMIKISGIFENKSYLLGNPYPSALNANQFIAANTGVIDGTLYFWTHTTEIQDRNDLTTDPVTGLTTAGSGAYAYSSDDYASFNGVGGVAVSGGLIPTGEIATAQGFFATSNATIIGTNEIIFNNSMRLDNSNNPMTNSQFFKSKNNTKENKIEKHRIWLDLTNTQGAFKQTLIGYLTNASNEYDNQFDGMSFDGNEFVDFYSVNQDKNLVIQGRALPFNENDEVPLGYKTKIEGDFTIKIKQIDGLLNNQNVFIEDKLTNTIFDLKKGDYTFNTKKGTFNDRFILRYNIKTLGNKEFEKSENQILVSLKNNQIKINSVTETIDKVTIYDLLGRQIFKINKVNNNQLYISNLTPSQQTIIINVSLQNGQTYSRKIIY